MGADTVTVLTSLSAPLAKTIVPTADGLAVRTAQNVLYYRGEECAVNDIRGLASLLDAISADPHKAIVRGAIAPGVNRHRMLRRKNASENENGTRTEPTLKEAPRWWVLLDVDGLAAPGEADPCEDPAGAVRYVIDLLPPAFRGVTCWWQFTASAGVKPGIRLRLAFWLDRPLGEADLKQWLAQRIRDPGKPRKDWLPEYPVDPSVFGTVNLIYTAAPIIGEGAHDPLSGRCPRSGLFEGERDVVAVPEIAPPEPPPAERYRGSGTGGGGSFDECLAAIGDHEGGGGCHLAVKTAVAVWWGREGAQADPEVLRRQLEARMGEAHWDPAEHPPERLRREIADLPRLIDSIRGMQRTKEAKNFEKFANADCPWPGEGMPLGEAEERLRAAVDAFFDVEVPKGRRLQQEYEQARERHRRVVAERDDAAAELEFGGEYDADSIFAEEPMPGEPEAPAYPQHGVKITAGAGKTHAVIRRLAADAGSGAVYVYAVPTHDKAEEVAADINAAAGKPVAAVWRGIGRDNPEAAGEKMCRRHELAHEIVRAGGEIAHLCGSEQRGYCPFHPDAGDGCAYRRQQCERPAVWVVPHALLTIVPPAAMARADALVVDEAWDIGSARPDELTLEELTVGRKKAHPFLGATLPRLKQALERVEPGGFLSRAPFVDEGLTLEDCRRAAKAEGQEFAPTRAFAPAEADEKIAAALEAAGADNRRVLARIAFWKELAAFLASEAKHAARLRMRGDAAALQIDAPRGVRGAWLDRPVLHLDATLNERVVRAWLPRFELKAGIRVARGEGVTVRQVTDQAVSYGKIVPGTAAAPGSPDHRTQENTLARIMRRVEVAAGVARLAGGSVACILPKAAREWAEAEWESWGTRPRNLSLGHFGALRGLNAMEGVSHLIVISRPEPQAGAVEAIVRRWLNTHPRPALAGGYYPRRAVALRTSDGGRAVVTEAYHPDQLADKCLRQIRDAEVEQAIHRARPARRCGERPLTIDIITGTPVDITVDNTLGLDDWLAEAPPAELLAARGFVPDTWAGRQAVLADLYPTAQAVRRGFQEARTGEHSAQGAAEKGAQTPYRESPIRDLGTFAARWPQYRYRLRGARRSHRVAVDPALHPDPAAAWAKRAGDLDLFESVEAQPCEVAPERPATTASAADEAPASPLPPPTVPEPPEPKAEPLITVEQLREHLGITPFALKLAMNRRRYRKLSGRKREEAAVEWMAEKVGRERFVATLSAITAEDRRGGCGA